MLNSSITLKITQGTAILKLVGQLRFQYAPALDQAFKKIQSSEKLFEVYLDLEGVEFMDSTILGTILKFAIESSKKDAKLNANVFISTISPYVSKMFSQIGLESYLKVKKYSSDFDKIDGTMITFDTRFDDKEALHDAVFIAHQLLSKFDPKDTNYKNVVTSIAQRKDTDKT